VTAFTSPAVDTAQTQRSIVPTNDDYASALIAAVGAQAAYDNDPTPANIEKLRQANYTLRYIRDARQRAAAKRAGLR
jgi:hypothetical protein